MSQLSLDAPLQPGADSEEARRGRIDFRYTLLCFFLSGWAALVYQTAWTRQFAVVFGTSELAIATVLSSYMAGLAIGAAVAARFVHRVRRPILLYGLLELGVAAGALLVPWGLRGASALQVLTIGGRSELPDAGGMAQPLFYFGVAFVLLLLPTTCMGATLPLLTRYAVRWNAELGGRVGALYAMNTFGAVVGTLATGFLLLPFLGVFQTTLLAVLANALVFGLAVQLERPGSVPPTGVAGEPVIDPSPRGGHWILPAVLVSGMVSFTYEVMWSRLLGQIIGGSVYAFATMLATFLTGITLGSALAGRCAANRRYGIWGFAGCQAGAAIASIGTYLSLEFVPELSLRLGAKAATADGLWANAALCAAVLLPSALFIGGTFPFAVRILADGARDAGPAAGRVYAWNTLGSVIGAALSGFWIVPVCGFAGTIWLCVAGGLGLACLSILHCDLLRWPGRLAWGAPAVAILLFFRPGSPEKVLSMSPLVDRQFFGELIFSAIGRSSTVRLTDCNGFYLLQNNGLPEAIIGRKGTPPFGGNLHRWLTLLPLAARPEADSMLVIGLGGGNAVDGIPATVEEIDVIELEPEVVAANRLISRRRELDPLADRRVRVILNDARGALSLSTKRYDIIVSQPSHPWTAGASHLYTREFMEQTKDHLAPGGVFLQWISSDFLDHELFRTTGATLLSMFRNVRMYQPNATTLFFLASDDPLDIESRIVRNGGLPQEHVAELALLPLTNVNDLLAMLTLDEEGLRELCRGAEPNTDDHNQLAFHSSPWAVADNGQAFSHSIRPADPLLNPASSLRRDRQLTAAVRPEALVLRMCILELWDRAEAYADSFPEPGRRQFLKGVIARSQGRGEDCRRLLRGALAADPSLNDARFLLCEQFTNEFLRGSVPDDVRTARQFLDGPEKTVFEASLALLQDDFPRLAAMEPQLAKVPPASLAYVFSLYYRAAWRSVPSADSQAWVRAHEALDLLDQAMAIWRRNNGYMMRLNASVLADEPAAALETSRQYLLHLLGDSELSPAAVREARRHLPTIRRLVEKLDADPRLEREVVAQVKAFVDGAADRLPPLAESATGVVPAGHFENPGMSSDSGNVRR